MLVPLVEGGGGVPVINGAEGVGVGVGVGVEPTFAVCPVNARLFNSTLEFEELIFAVMMSSRPSPFTSPKVTEFGPDPVAKAILVWKVPLPMPNKTLALLER